MSDDASLTDFAGGGDDDSGDNDENDGKHDGADEGGEAVEDEERVSVEREENDDPSNTDPAEKPTYTYTSTPDGAECDACGGVVEVRWHAGEGGTAADPDLPTDALVCPDCKEW